MPNQKISELTAVTYPMPGDVLPIVNAGSTKKVAVSGVSGVRDIGSGSLTSNRAAVAGYNSITLGHGALGRFNPAGGTSLSIDNIIIGCDSAKFKNCQGGFEKVACNVFLGTGIASTYPDCATGGQPYANQGTRSNVFIGNRAAQDIFSYFRQDAGPCGTYTTDNTVAYNIVIGSSAALNRQKLSSNVIIGQTAHSLTSLCNLAGNINASGHGTVAIGTNAGSNNTYSNYNVFIGHNAGAFTGSCTVSIKNVGIGTGTFMFRREARYAVALGFNAFSGEGSPFAVGNPRVCFSTGVGWKAGSRLVASNDDVIIGALSIGGSTLNCVGSLSASGNVIIGNRAFGFTNQNGYVANLALRNNTIIGYRGALRSRGSNNIMIGSNTAADQTPGYQLASLSGTIVLGNDAQPLANNTLVLGSATSPLSTVATAGAAAGFLIVNINGTHRKIAFNN